MATLNWPAIDEAISVPSGASTATVDYWVSLTSRSRSSNSIRRGRQYELDTVQAGEYQAVYDNRDGVLSPVNTAGPWYPYVRPNVPLRKRAQWPITANQLTGDQATSGQITPIAAGSTVPYYYGTVATPVATASATAFEGTQVMQVSVPANTTVGNALVYLTGFSLKPGVAHTFSIYARTTTGTSALQAAAAISWITPAGAIGTTTNGSTSTLPTASNTWTRLTVTATPPSTAVGALVGVNNMNSPTATFTFQTDGAQLEYAASASTWAAPGTWYPLFRGFVERWPITYTQSGSNITTTPTVVDTFGWLSQQKLKPAFYNAVLAYNPNVFYPLDEGQGAQYAIDRTRNRQPAPVTVSPYGSGGLTFGNSIQSTTPMDVVNGLGAFVGAGSKVATFTNASVTGNQNALTYIDLSKDNKLPAGDATGYTRIIAFRCPSIPPTGGVRPVMWGWNQSTYSWPYGGQNYWGIFATGDTVPGAAFFGSGGFSFLGNSVNMCDGNWHIVAVRVNPSNGNLSVWTDGTGYGTGNSTSLMISTLGGDALGANIIAGQNVYNQAYAGDLSCAIEIPTWLSDTQMGDLYTAWRVAYRGESSSSRYSRLLGYAGYKGATSLTTGPATNSMGPASDIAQGSSAGGIYSPTTGLDGLSALQAVVTTENGNHFVAADGTVTFQSRAQRYFIASPAVTFGENVGEVPYEDLGFDFDTTRLANDAQITQWFNSAVYEKFNTSSQTQYGTRTLTRTVNSMSVPECNDAAAYFVYRYGNPDLRVSKIRIHPSAVPSMWPTVLSLELGTRVRVNRRPLGQQSITWNGFVENIQWTFNHDTGDAYCDLQISPNDMLTFWETGAWHSTLKNAASAGATSIVLNPLTDASTIPFSAYIPCQVAGTTSTVSVAAYNMGSPSSPTSVPAPKMRVGSGAGTWEEVTVTSFTCTGGTQVTRVNGLGNTVNVPGAFTGYTSVTINFTPALVNSYAIGAQVSESLFTPNITPYPGTPVQLTTDPTVYDPNTVLDSTTIIGY